MYRKPKYKGTSIRVNESTEGETIEQKMERILNNEAIVSEGAPLIYTERKDGVLPGYDPRTDRFEIAVEAMDKVTASRNAKRIDAREKREAKVVKMNENDSGAKPIQGTNE